MQELSVCMIVKNEATHIMRCLNSVCTFSTEIIVVDTGSSDQTKELIQNIENVYVYDFVWQDNFAMARNYALQQATKDWILVIDADEEVVSGQDILDIIQQNSVDAYSLCIRNILPISDNLLYEDTYATRLFRNHQTYRYRGAIHEDISESILQKNGVIQQYATMLLHYGYANDIVQGMESRKERNLRLLKRELQQDPTDYYYWFQLGKALQVYNVRTALFCFDQSIRCGFSKMSPMIQVEMYIRQAQIYTGLHQARDAHSSLDRVLEIDATNVKAHSLLVVLYMESKEYRQALRSLKILLHSAQYKNKDELVQLEKWCRINLS